MSKVKGEGALIVTMAPLAMNVRISELLAVEVRPAPVQLVQPEVTLYAEATSPEVVAFATSYPTPNTVEALELFDEIVAVHDPVEPIGAVQSPIASDPVVGVRAAVKVSPQPEGVFQLVFEFDPAKITAMLPLVMLVVKAIVDEGFVVKAPGESLN